jgi:EAL domain-containing protein (putative c-di-GMP-specific phosphodiesterase class I)
MLTRVAATARPGELIHVLNTRVVEVEFQPIVHLETLETVGYEALSRGPSGAPITALFAEARRIGREKELDWICRASVLRAALDAGMPPTLSLFVNVEPGSLGARCPPDLAGTVAAATEQLDIVLEVTERSVDDDPATLLSAVDGARQSGMALALDDVGADPASLAMMSLIGPDVIKLDLSVIQGRSTRAVARIVNAALAEAERTGAAIVAEGIESSRHVDAARAMGAGFGQGWQFGRPGSLPRSAVGSNPPLTGERIQRLPFIASEIRTPFDAVSGRLVRRGTDKVLLPMSLHLEYMGFDAAVATVLLACFRDRRHFSAASRRRFSRLASRGVFTAVVGEQIPPEPAPGVRGASLPPDDPMNREWSTILVGPHFAGALLARECGAGEVGPDHPHRLFDFVFTHDRGIVLSAARAILSRLSAGRPAGALPPQAYGI